MSQDIKTFPAPWDLKGSGYIFLYKFKKGYDDLKFKTPNFLKGKYCGGLGSVMLVNYLSSNAGGYQEFLLIPGKYKFKNKKLNTISKIYVSSDESVFNGQKNWGIPKEKANFIFKNLNNCEEEISVSFNEETIAKFILKSAKLKFLVNTKLLPFPLVQEYENKYFYTNFFGKGKGKFSKIKEIYINEKYFPDISKYKPIMVIKVEDFKITFPKPLIENKEE